MSTRGHWPKGVPRSELRPGVMAALRAARTASSLRQIAARLGTDYSTVRKWLAGINQPSEMYQKRILEAYGTKGK